MPYLVLLSERDDQYVLVNGSNNVINHNNKHSFPSFPVFSLTLEVQDVYCLRAVVLQIAPLSSSD